MMKRHRAVTYALLLLLVVTSCQKPANSSSSADSSTESPTTDSSGTISTNTTSSATSESITEVPPSSSPSSEGGSESTSETSEPPAINTTIKNFQSNGKLYANTNGNANNRGLAVYDHGRHLHYFALGNNIYSFNPATNVTAVLYTGTGSGQIQNLALLNDDLYFVSTVSNYFHRFDLVAKTVDLIYEEETSLLYGYSNTIFATVKRLNYNNEFVDGLRTYNHAKKETTTKYNQGVTNLNLNGTHLYFTDNNVATLRVMDASFQGKSTIYNFLDLEFEEIIGMQLISATYSTPEVLTFALLLKDTVRTTLYMFNTGDNKLTKVKEGADIHSLNSDGEYVYFIASDSLYKYHIANSELSSGSYLFSGAKYLQVLNHWLYIGNALRTTMYRFDPGENEFVTDFWQ